MDTGLIHLYCGDGKGKTTAAAGLAARCVGGGGKAAFFQFLKDNTSGERAALTDAGIDVIDGYDNLGKVWTFTEEQVRDMFVWYEDKFGEIRKIAGGYDLLVLDEVIDAVNYGYIRRDTILDFLRGKPSGLEVVLTGRNPEREFLEIADYVTEMRKIKHPYDKGVKARKLIEF